MYEVTIEVNDMFTSLEMVSWLVDEVGLEHYRLSSPDLGHELHVQLSELDKFIYHLKFEDKNMLLFFEIVFSGRFKSISDLESYVKKYADPTAGSSQ